MSRTPVTPVNAPPAWKVGDLVELPSGRQAELVDFVAGRCLLKYADDESEVLLQSKLLREAQESPLLTGTLSLP